MDGKKEGRMKDGTKTDNGICIQTMPTWNYFSFVQKCENDVIQKIFNLFDHSQ